MHTTSNAIITIVLLLLTYKYGTRVIPIITLQENVNINSYTVSDSLLRKRSQRLYKHVNRARVQK